MTPGIIESMGAVWISTHDILYEYLFSFVYLFPLYCFFFNKREEGCVSYLLATFLKNVSTDSVNRQDNLKMIQDKNKSWSEIHNVEMCVYW